MSEFFVETQCWAHWPKVLVMGRNRNDGTVERRRYVPERTCEPNTFLADAGENWERWATECGECGAVLHESYTSKVRVLPNYCPHCGAKVADE